MYLYAFLLAQFPEHFSCVRHVWNYYGDILFVVGWWIVVVVVWWWWWWVGWGWWICFAIGWGSSLETDNVVMLSWFVGVPVQFATHFATRGPISTLGQQPPHHCQTKCLQHPSTQGQNNILHTRQTGQGTPNTSGEHYNIVSFQTGPSTNGKTNSPTPTNPPPPPPTTTTTIHQPTTKRISP